MVPLYGHTAVERNQLKRRLREIIRAHVLRTLIPLDAVVKAQRNAYRASFDVLVNELKDGMTAAERLLS